MYQATLSEIERLAGLMFSADEVATILGIEEADRGDDFALAMLRGRLQAEALVRDSIITLAKAGSAPAQALAKQLIDQARVARAGE